MAVVGVGGMEVRGRGQPVLPPEFLDTYAIDLVVLKIDAFSSS